MSAIKDSSFQPLPHYYFPPSSKVVQQVKGQYPTDQIIAEPALYSASLEFAMEKGGIITKNILSKIVQLPDIQKVMNNELPGHQIIIDSRVHDLTEGEYPAIPGWHSDFAERGPSTNYQPDYRLVTPTVRAYVVNISDTAGGVSNTEYVNEGVNLDLPTENVYMKVDQQLRALTNLKTFKANDGDIVEMDQLSLHKATPAHANGKRYFLRLGIVHDLQKTILQDKLQNEFRTHVHTYRNTESPEKDRPLFNSSRFELIGPIKGQCTVNEIKSEPILIDTSIEFAKAHGGIITKMFIDKVENHPLMKDIDGSKVTLNTRVHMLMKGQFPDLALWRTGAPFEGSGQPERKEKAHHFVLLCSSKLNGVANIEIDSLENTIPEGSIVHFEDGTLNRALPAHDSGWRLAIVMSLYSDSIQQNRTTKQLPIYLDNISLGW